MTQILTRPRWRRLSLLLACSIAAGAHVNDRTVRVQAGSRDSSDPPGYTTARRGDVHDFDDFAGGWRTLQRRLTARGVGRGGRD